MKRYLIEDLIRKPMLVPLKGSKKIELWVRPLENTERDMATAFGRKASRRMRAMLSNKKGEEYDALVREEYEGANPDDLRKIWANGRLLPRAVQIRAASLEEREYVPEPEGEGVTPKQMDEYEDKVDEAEERREEQLSKALESAQRELDEEAAKIPEKELFEAAIPSIIEVQCQRAYETEFVSQMLLRGTFEDKDCTKKAFKDIEQVYKFANSTPANYTLLTNAHISMMLDSEAVKN